MISTLNAAGAQLVETGRTESRVEQFLQGDRGLYSQPASCCAGLLTNTKRQGHRDQAQSDIIVS